MASKVAQKAVESPTIQDIAWAAGIWEGEGSCALIPKSKWSGGGHFITAYQSDPWLLYRLAALFGGRVSQRKRGPRGFSGRSDAGWRWDIYGARARGFIMTIYKFLSPKRKAQVQSKLLVRVPSGK